MKTHSSLGAETVIEASKSVGKDFLKLAIDIIYYHHEKNDGSGYPKGLKGKKIPLAARIMSIADIYDALRSERYYKKAFDHEKSVDIILNQNGVQYFHQDILTAFKKVENNFKVIAEELKDE
jgi:putative two-component system response regulator